MNPTQAPTRDDWRPYARALADELTAHPMDLHPYVPALFTRTPATCSCPGSTTAATTPPSTTPAPPTPPTCTRWHRRTPAA